MIVIVRLFSDATKLFNNKNLVFNQILQRQKIIKIKEYITIMYWIINFERYSTMTLTVCAHNLSYCEIIFIRRGHCFWVAKIFLVRGDVIMLHVVV